jgi:hypothetical protein
MKKSILALSLLALVATSAFASQEVAPSPNFDQLSFVFKLKQINDKKLGTISVFDYSNGPAANPTHIVLSIPTGETEGDSVVTRQYVLPGNFSSLKSIKFEGVKLLVEAKRTNIETMEQEQVFLLVTYRDTDGKALETLQVR